MEAVFVSILFLVCGFVEKSQQAPSFAKKVYFCRTKRQKTMSEKEINAYRLTSLEEPTDEMLAYIMREVAEEAKEKYDRAIERYFMEIKEMYQKQYGDN